MGYNLKAKDLTSYRHAIDAAASSEEAKAKFIEMVENFQFKKKQRLFKTKTEIFSMTKREFQFWAYNTILSSEGLGV